jgi:hypothetical protein
MLFKLAYNLLIPLPKVLQVVINVFYWYTIGNFHKNKKLFVNHQTENEFDERIFPISFSTWIIRSIGLEKGVTPQ